MAKRYSFNIAWSEEDQEYVATCPAFPGLSALGETEEEALAEGKIALGAFIEACKQEHASLPDDQLANAYSGQFRVRLPKSLHRQAAQLAATDGISLNQLVISAVEQRVGVKTAGTRMLAEMKQVWTEYAAQFKVALASALTSDQRLTTAQTISESTYTETERVITGRSIKGN